MPLTDKEAIAQFIMTEATILTQIGQQLQRTPPEQAGDLLIQAAECVARCTLHKVRYDEKPSAIIADTVADDLEAPMQALAATICEFVRPHGFALLVFPFNEIDGGSMNYVSNTGRDDICSTMREFIAAHENRLFAGPDRIQ